ncbi:MAG: hypothetical protein LBS27_10590 [Bifidobacteriaceae bacterium]|jgi:hypothetical protein|nr:hypothetical protein [Bifidobacteriaceae bacterium]
MSSKLLIILAAGAALVSIALGAASRLFGWGDISLFVILLPLAVYAVAAALLREKSKKSEPKSPAAG